MTTSELKSIIHKKIDDIEDEKFLNSLKEIIEANNSSPEEQVIADWQWERVKESEKQIEAGHFITKEESDKKIEEWLKK